MPVYSRRRIQQMLDELSGIIRPSHFIGRLNDKRFENAIPAEAELGLVWAANALGGFESEPAWFSDSNKRPEGVSDAFSPKHERSFMANSHYYWQVTVMVRQGLDMPMSGLQALASKLPAPRFDGYAYHQR